ncbi:hypothetical protein QYE76_053791 [Lolium multiflorum]|uniref:Retrotransposon gag domain-containing protein n=1 Tax=Lolium multiflorum TaxID=4521 RepID=A0AAD8WK75_LOLMU|nr:hypothetical protein QYE76_053791 [Lolium multiflorum]
MYLPPPRRQSAAIARRRSRSRAAFGAVRALGSIARRRHHVLAATSRAPRPSQSSDREHATAATEPRSDNAPGAHAQSLLDQAITLDNNIKKEENRREDSAIARTTLSRSTRSTILEESGVTTHTSIMVISVENGNNYNSHRHNEGFKETIPIVTPMVTMVITMETMASTILIQGTKPNPFQKGHVNHLYVEEVANEPNAVMDCEEAKDILVIAVIVWVALIKANDLDWETFKEGFRTAHISLGIMNLKRDEFRSLRQGGRTLKEYMDDFYALARYAPEDIDTDVKRKEKFLNGLKGELKIPLFVAYAPNY